MKGSLLSDARSTHTGPLCTCGLRHLSQQPLSASRNERTGVPRVAHLVEHRTLDFGSGHDLAVVALSPASGSVLTARSSDSLSLSLSAPSPLALVLSK